MWIIQADTRNHTLTHTHRHTHTRAVGYRESFDWYMYCILFMWNTHAHATCLDFFKFFFALCSLQSISRERCDWVRARERELHTDTNNNTDNAHSLLLCPLAFFLCLRLRKTRIIYINNNPDYERFTQCDRMQPMCKIPLVLLRKIPMYFASLHSVGINNRP